MKTFMVIFFILICLMLLAWAFSYFRYTQWQSVSCNGGLCNAPKRDKWDSVRYHIKGITIVLVVIFVSIWLFVFIFGGGPFIILDAPRARVMREEYKELIWEIERDDSRNDSGQLKEEIIDKIFDWNKKLAECKNDECWMYSLCPQFNAYRDLKIIDIDVIERKTETP